MITPARLRTALVHFKHSGSPARPHGIATRAFHWLAGGLLVYGLVFPAEIEDLSDPAALALEARFALAVGAVFLIRFIWVEFIAGGARLPPDAPCWERVLSRVVHYGIYALVLAVVLSGLAIALAASPAPTLFGVNVAFLASGVSQGFLLDLHEAFATTLILLIAAHLFGANWHWMTRRDGVWESMLRGSAHRELR